VFRNKKVKIKQALRPLIDCFSGGKQMTRCRGFEDYPIEGFYTVLFR